MALSANQETTESQPITARHWSVSLKPRQRIMSGNLPEIIHFKSDLFTLLFSIVRFSFWSSRFLIFSICFSRWLAKNILRLSISFDHWSKRCLKDFNFSSMGSEFYFVKYFDPEIEFQIESLSILCVIKLNFKAEQSDSDTMLKLFMHPWI